MVNNHYRWDFIGLSTDVKPTPSTSLKVVDGSTFYCSDTSKLYVYCKNNWYERKPLGSGGGSYTAGTGITIADDTISVDTTTIQEKLTAGTGIDITGNTISATGGGGAPTVVQTTGDSTTDVMSQNATTSMVYHDTTKTCVQIGLDASATRTSTNSQIAIGKGATASGSGYNIVIGNNASASAATKAIAIGGQTGTRDYCINIGGAIRNNGGNYNVAIGGDTGGSSHAYCVALGHGSTCTRTGEVNIGAGGTHGYNSSEYRILGGVYDGQLAQDAVTVNQVNSVIDAINAALSTNISHIGA